MQFYLDMGIKCTGMLNAYYHLQVAYWNPDIDIILRKAPSN